MGLALIGMLAFPSAALHAQTQCTASAPTSAPTCPLTVAATVTVAHLLQLNVSGTQTNLAPPVVTTYDSSAAAANANGYPVGATGPTVTVKANRGWKLTVSSQNDYWSFTPDATYQQCRPGGGTYSSCTGSSSSVAGKASSDLAWSLNANTAFAGLTSTPALLSSNATGSSASYTLYYRVRWAYASDVPGTYTLNVVFTVTGQ